MIGFSIKNILFTTLFILIIIVISLSVLKPSIIGYFIVDSEEDVSDIIRTANIPDCTIKEEEFIIIDLSEYFYCEDRLIYSFIPVSGLNINVDDEVLIIKGERPGAYSISIYATQGKYSIESNEFLVRVLI